MTKTGTHTTTNKQIHGHTYTFICKHTFLNLLSILFIAQNGDIKSYLTPFLKKKNKAPVKELFSAILRK